MAGISPQLVTTSERCLRGAPPAILPERLSDDLLPIAAGFQREEVCFDDATIQGHDACKQRSLLIERPASNFRSRSSALFRSVMSRATLDAPITCPLESLIGDTVMETLSCRPSFLVGLTNFLLGSLPNIKNSLAVSKVVTRSCFASSSDSGLSALVNFFRERRSLQTRPNLRKSLFPSGRSVVAECPKSNDADLTRAPDLGFFPK